MNDDLKPEVELVARRVREMSTGDAPAPSQVKAESLGPRVSQVFEDLQTVRDRIQSIAVTLNIGAVEESPNGAVPAGSLGGQRINEVDEVHNQIMSIIEALNNIDTEVQRFA